MLPKPSLKHLLVDSYPPGWPQLAAFMHSEDNFAIFRRFGLVHCRVLVQLQAEIQLLEKKLSALDQSDASPGSPNAWRLQTAEFKEGWDAEKKDLVAELVDKLLKYGKVHAYTSFKQSLTITQTHCY
jgi:hypothetical protein